MRYQAIPLTNERACIIARVSFLRTLHWLSLFEGVSTLVLFLIAMPLEYLAGVPAAVTIVGTLHGALFTAFVVMLLLGVWRAPISPKMTAVGIVAAVLPGGPFLFDRRLARIEQRAHPRGTMRTVAMAIVIAASLQSAATHAQERSPLPDPAAVVVPDLSGSDRPEVIKDGWKYFFFWKDGVRFEEAHADLADCRRFLHPNSWQDVHLKRFVPWDSRPGRRTVAATGNYGLVGAVIAGIVEGSLQHRDYQANMRSCMEPRGYTRYGVAARIWKNVTSLPQDQSIAVQAKIASGPAFGKVPHQ